MSDTADKMQEAANAIRVILPPGTGFVLLAFDFDRGGKSRLDYVSNAERESAVETMKEFIRKTEGRGNWGKHLEAGPQPPG